MTRDDYTRESVKRCEGCNQRRWIYDFDWGYCEDCWTCRCGERAEEPEALCAECHERLVDWAHDTLKERQNGSI